MKVCPKCNTQYENEMSFCLQDGTPLILADPNSEVTQVLETKPPDSEITQIQGDLTLRMDEKTIALPDQEKEFVTGEKTLLMPEATPAPTEQMNFVNTNDTPQLTDKMQVVIPTEEPKLETVSSPPPPSRTGLIMAAVFGVLVIFATAIGGLIYLNPFGKNDDVAVVNPNNSSSNQISNPTNSNPTNSNPANSDVTNLFGDNSSSSELPSNTGSKPSPTTSPTIQTNFNKPTPKPTKEEETPSPKPTATLTPFPTPTPTITPPPTRTPPLVPKIVSAGVVNGKAINLVKPPYPPAAKAVRASGAVAVQVTIDENGNVISASAVSGHALLRAAAESAARASKFSPTMLSGQRVKVTGVIIYNFTAQ